MPGNNIVILRWIDKGKYKDKIEHVDRRFVQNKGVLLVGQEVTVQFTKKKQSRAKIWNVIVEDLGDENESEKLADKGKKRKQTKEPTKVSVICIKLLQHNYNKIILLLLLFMEYNYTHVVIYYFIIMYRHQNGAKKTEEIKMMNS